MDLDVRTCIGARIEQPNREWVTLELFQRTNKKGEWSSPIDRICILYGKNGAGKSTIGRNFAGPGLISVHRQEDNPTVTENEIACRNVHVFSDEYVHRKIRIKDGSADGLGAIALLGEQVDVQQQIDEGETAIEELSSQIVLKKSSIEDLEASAESALKQWRKTLRSKGGWAERQKVLDNQKTNKHVTDIVLDNLGMVLSEIGDSDTLADDRTSFDARVGEFLNSSTAEHDPWKAPAVPQHFDVAKLEILRDERRSVTVPTQGDSAAQKLTRMEPSLATLDHLLELALDEGLECCPTCLRDLNETVRSDIKQAVLAVKEAYSAQGGVKPSSLVVNPDRIGDQPSLPSNVEISAEALQSLRSAFDKYREEISTLNSLLLHAEDNPADAFNFETDRLDRAIEGLILRYEAVAKEVDSHNRRIAEVNSEKSALSNLNLRLAAQESKVNAWVYGYNLLLKLQAQTELTELIVQRGELKNDLVALNAKLESTEEAASRINEYLRVVFGRNGLSLKVEGHGYSVWNEGVVVPVDKLSTGEGNILALSYFFVEAADGQNYAQFAGMNQLFVLDDPISSFDADNRYGVMALLAYVTYFHNVLHSETRFLFMTHDLSVAYDLENAVMSGYKDSINTVEYDSGSLIKVASFAEVDFYRRTLSKMYKVAIGEEGVASVSSNDVRRVYEAYCRFGLAEKITEAANSQLVRDHFAQNGLASAAFQSTFMARVFANPGSHTETNVTFFDFYILDDLSPVEMRRFVQEMLVFMHVLSPIHIPGKLGDKKADKSAIREQMDSMREEIAGWVTTDSAKSRIAKIN